jgi:hypothetical protein
MSVVLYDPAGVPQPAGTILLANTATDYSADYTFKVSEPILGLPTLK